MANVLVEEQCLIDIANAIRENNKQTSLYKPREMAQAIREGHNVYGFIEHMDIAAPTQRIEYVGLNKTFTAMRVDLVNHRIDYGPWSSFPSIMENKPCMVKSTGELDYLLNPDDYTKKLNGQESDVKNEMYDGGAFSKFVKVYVKRWIDGDNRHVRFSFSPLDGYYPCGFIDENGEEMDYVWLPMFYGCFNNNMLKTVAVGHPNINMTLDEQYRAIKQFSERGAFLGGGVVETIRDMLYMLFKTTNLQAACGSGCQDSYDANSQLYGLFDNQVVDGGQFYGTANNRSLNKIFHSIVLGSYQQWQRDPYYLCVDGRFKVSTDYTYDSTGEKYLDTGIDSKTVDASKWLYPDRTQVVDQFGCIPNSFRGSKTTGYCDAIYYPQNKNITAIIKRFGNNTIGANAGLSTMDLSSTSDVRAWGIGASVLLRPPLVL